MQNKNTLKNLREEIDEIDDQVIMLLEKRLKIAAKIGHIKTTLTDAKREKAILDKINSSYIKNIYKEIFKNSKKLMKKINLP